jgi:branched-chain amino acid transport system substrate-binding protein
MSPWTQLLELGLPSAGITLVTGAPDLPQLRGMVPLGKIGGKGYCVYYPTLPQAEPLNDWMVERHQAEYGFAPDFFTSGGFAAAVAICTALEKTGGDTEARTLIDTMEGMEFESPTGKRVFRQEDHQAMQDLFEVELTWEEGSDHCIPKYISVIPSDEITPPITNGR